MSLAIVPGSFDPMTIGHVDIIETVSKRYDEVVVAVMINRSKRYCFSMETRVAIAERSVAHLPNVRVISDSGMLIDLFDRLGADAVCKGWRNNRDYDYELHMADWNQAHNPRFRTELIYAKADHRDISSTLVRDKLLAGEDFSAYVHPNALPILLGESK